MPPMGVEANLEMGYTEEGGTLGYCSVSQIPWSSVLKGARNSVVSRGGFSRGQEKATRIP